jgi:hypothetical protein
LALQLLLFILKDSSFVFFLSNVSLDAKHKQYFLAQFIKKLHILGGRYYFIRDVHALKYLGESFAYFAWKGKLLRKVLLAGIDFLILTHLILVGQFIELEEFLRRLI